MDGNIVISALGAQQFRLNMSRDYELARISAESPTFVEYVRQRQEHLASRPRRPSSPPPTTTPRVEVLDRILGKIVSIVHWRLARNLFKYAYQLNCDEH